MNCVKCGFQVKPEDKIVVYGAIQHRDCFGAMIDLVEAAEGRIAELEAELAAERDDPDAAQAALETLRGELD